eukprot:4860082-Prymnesium_polylepis.1
MSRGFHSHEHSTTKSHAVSQTTHGQTFDARAAGAGACRGLAEQGNTPNGVQHVCTGGTGRPLRWRRGCAEAS